MLQRVQNFMTADRWTAVTCMVISAVVIAAMPYETSDRPIPGARGFDLLDGAFFPKIAVTLFLIAAIWLFLEGWNKPADAAENEDDQPPGLSFRDLAYASGLTALVLIYVQFLGYFGYLVSTIAAVAILALICGQRSWLGLLLGAVLFPIVVYYLFAELFLVPLPRAQFW